MSRSRRTMEEERCDRSLTTVLAVKCGPAVELPSIDVFILLATLTTWTYILPLVSYEHCAKPRPLAMGEGSHRSSDATENIVAIVPGMNGLVLRIVLQIVPSALYAHNLPVWGYSVTLNVENMPLVAFGMPLSSSNRSTTV